MQPGEWDVIIVEDDDAVRDALCELFAADGLRPRPFASAEAFLSAGLTEGRACLVVDIHMPGMTGLELQAELKRRGATTPIVVITGQADVPKAVEALKAGAVDFIEKPFNPSTLVKAVNDALAQDAWTQRAMTEAPDVRARISLLTPRENEVMELMVNGHPNKVIAAKLGISVRTVENHRAKVMTKMKCDHLSSLVSLVLRLRIHDR